MSETIQTGKARRRRSPAKWMISAAAILLLAAALLVLWPSINKARTIWSLQKVDDYPLYTMAYYGDYQLDYTVDDPRLQFASTLCSSFLARNEKGEPLLCRNLDYALAGHPICMVSTNAPGKNAGLAICDLYYLGYQSGKLPSGSIFQDGALLSAPRVPMDGINEYGVALAVLSVPHAEAPFDPDRQTIDEAAAVRLVLDNAKTVTEAVEVIGSYNMLFHEGAGHIMIADRKGDSVVLEYVNGEISVVKSDNPWQIATNFILSSPNREGVGQDRYDRAEAALSKSKGILSEEAAMDLLSRISQPGTLWSVIYNLTTGEARLALKMNYKKVYEFTLKMHP
jgi:hypothetical protein